LKATNPVFLEEEDTDDELEDSLIGRKEKIVITLEFVRKNKKTLISELEKMDREEIMELTSKLTYEGVTPGGAPVTNVATPSNATVTGTATQTNTATVASMVPVIPAQADQSGLEGNILTMLSSLLRAMNVQNAGGNVQSTGVQNQLARR
jgi:hypothetical protein